MFMNKKNVMYDGIFRIFRSASTDLATGDPLVFSFSLRGYPSASSLEKIRANIDAGEDFYVTLEYRVYEIETNF